jgi:hypothetical protein
LKKTKQGDEEDKDRGDEEDEIERRGRYERKTRGSRRRESLARPSGDGWMSKREKI